MLSMDGAAVALKRYEEVLRLELETPCLIDTFCDVPESKAGVSALAIT